MPEFDALFALTDGRVAIYNSKTIVRLDYLPLSPGGSILRCKVVSVASSLPQAIGLETEQEDMIVEHVQIPKRKALLKWDIYTGKEFTIELSPKSQTLLVYNAWRWPAGNHDYWHRGGAMIVEDIPDGRRYRCNDGEPDDDFDDLILELIVESQK